MKFKNAICNFNVLCVVRLKNVTSHYRLLSGISSVLTWNYLLRAVSPIRCRLSMEIVSFVSAHFSPNIYKRRKQKQKLKKAH